MQKFKNPALRFTGIYFCTTILFLILAEPIFAQVPKAPRVSWSAGESTNSKNWYTMVLGGNEKGTFLLRSNLPLDREEITQAFRTRRFSLVCYDQAMTLKWEKTLDAPKKDGVIEKIIYWENEIVVVYSQPDRDLEGIRAFAQLIDWQGNFKDHPDTLMEIRNMKRGSDPVFSYAFSANHQQLAIACNWLGLENNGSSPAKEKISLALFNLKSGSWFRNLFSFPEENRDFIPAFFFLSNDSVFTLAGRKTKKEEDCSVQFMSLDAKSNGVSFSAFATPARLVSDFMISHDSKNKRFLLAGLYSEVSIGSSAGIFTMAVNSTDLTLYHSTHHPFDSKVMDGFIGDPKTPDKKEILNLKPVRLVKREDGGLIFLAESQYATDYTYFDFFTKTYITRIMYHFDHVVTASVSPIGKLEWQKTLIKKQESQEDGGYYSSFYTILNANELHLLYNSFEGKLTRVHLHSFRTDGTEYASVISDLSDDAAAVPRSGKQTDSGTTVVPAFKKNKFTLLKIFYPDGGL